MGVSDIAGLAAGLRETNFSLVPQCRRRAGAPAASMSDAETPSGAAALGLTSARRSELPHVGGCSADSTAGGCAWRGAAGGFVDSRAAGAAAPLHGFGCADGERAGGSGPLAACGGLACWSTGANGLLLTGGATSAGSPRADVCGCCFGAVCMACGGSSAPLSAGAVGRRAPPAVSAVAAALRLLPTLPVESPPPRRAGPAAVSECLSSCGNAQEISSHDPVMSSCHKSTLLPPDDCNFE